MEHEGDSCKLMQSTHVNRDAIGLGSFVNNSLIGHRSTFLELLKHKNKKIAVKQYWQISDKEVRLTLPIQSSQSTIFIHIIRLFSDSEQHRYSNDLTLRLLVKL